MSVVASVCMATFDRPAKMLERTLASIFRQNPPFDYEVIVIDDGGQDPERAKAVCSAYPVRFHRIERPHRRRNPCFARNTAYRMARGRVVITQSDEVMHVTEDAIERLVTDLKPGTFLLANVKALSPGGQVWSEYIGLVRSLPYFFLGSLSREDLYAVGGNDEDFVEPAFEDDWFADCLIQGRKLRPVYTTSIVGWHQYHDRFTTDEGDAVSRAVYDRKKRDATEGKIPWTAASGPWPLSGVLEDTFTSIHKDKGFFDPDSGGTDESISGAGSSRSATARIEKEIPILLKKYGVKTFLDAACGDHNWMRHVDLGVHAYLGMDVVKELVEENRRRFGREGVDFIHADVMTADLPGVDLIFLRDCLVHLSFDGAKATLRNLIRSGSTYLLTTTFTDRTENAVIFTGGWASYNLQIEPFCLPPPLEIINEDCREHFPNFQDKSLGLWRLEDLRSVPCLM